VGMSGGGGCLLEIINGGRVHALNICSGVAAMVHGENNNADDTG
jgi:hypothetical protein